ncbi:uncharacterized protein LOC124926879 [Impatiens glandulifera]|uniref:uncharacterized protein LOC124926879 n=1 Tax=Impatiens glandulifera TaxID=253017 RepID=UPI001FB1170F|nr:uncharacterized protein LOC124926879 [Impatiens glandulifera]
MLKSCERRRRRRRRRRMSLVDYASSDDDDESELKDEGEEMKDLKSVQDKPDFPKLHVHPPPKTQRFSSTTPKQSNPEPSVVKLPDASMLMNSLDSPSYPANYPWVSAAVTRKRDASGFGSSSSSLMHGKIPKATPVHSKSIPDTIRGQLVPPQVKGRSNVVTEDIGKLFVRKKVETSTQSVSDQ